MMGYVLGGYVGVLHVVISIMILNKRTGNRTNITITQYLDRCINEMVNIRKEFIADDDKLEEMRADHYVDAYQSLRMYILGEPLEID